jgi:cytochrome c peroxidase
MAAVQRILKHKRVLAAAAGGAFASVNAWGNRDRAECLGQKADWTQIKANLESLYDDERALNPSIDGAEGAKGGGGFVAPLMVRLAWHSAGTYKEADGSGGTDGGTIRFDPEINHGGNAGLVHAIKLLEPVKAAHPAATWADLIVFAGCVAVESMGGPTIGFRPGRTDAPKPDISPSTDKRFTPDDRLPDGAEGAAHLRNVFGRMGFNDQEIVALSGAHAVGRCHTDRSGFWGPWKYGEASFSNEYYTFLLDKEWTVKQTHDMPSAHCPVAGPWKGPRQYEADGGALMMLPTDMALVQDAEFKKWVSRAVHGRVHECVPSHVHGHGPGPLPRQLIGHVHGQVPGRIPRRQPGRLLGRIPAHIPAYLTKPPDASLGMSTDASLHTSSDASLMLLGAPAWTFPPAHLPASLPPLRRAHGSGRLITVPRSSLAIG